MCNEGNNVNDIVRDRVLSVIEKSGLGDAYVQEQLHLPSSSIYKWRNKINKSYKKYIYEIANFFDVSPDYLLGKIDTPLFHSILEEQEEWGDIDLRLIREVQELTTDEQALLLGYVEFLRTHRKNEDTDSD